GALSFASAGRHRRGEAGTRRVHLRAVPHLAPESSGADFLSPLHPCGLGFAEGGTTFSASSGALVPSGRELSSSGSSVWGRRCATCLPIKGSSSGSPVWIGRRRAQYIK